MTAHHTLVRRMRDVFKAAGYPIVLARAFDRRTPSHQCGTVRFGTDPATSALDPFCRAHDHPNLYVVDASLPADLGRREPCAHHRGAGTARRRPPRRRHGAPGIRAGPCLSAPSPWSPAVGAASAGRSPRPRRRQASTSRSPISPRRRARRWRPSGRTAPRPSSSSPTSPISPPIRHCWRRSSTASAASTAWSTMPAWARWSRGDVLDLLPENFDRVIGVNLRGTVFLTQAVARWMLAHPAPGVARSIVHVTSVSAAMASPERLDYCVSKAGLAMWSKGLALRLAPEGIAVFDVRPGIIRTDMTAGVAGDLRPPDRRGPGAGAAVGRTRGCGRRGGGARARRVPLRHRQRDRRRRWPGHPEAVTRGR